MCPEATSRIGTLTRMRKLVTEKTKLLLSKSVILSGLNYCSTVRFFITASDKRKLERMQEKGLRTVRELVEEGNPANFMQQKTAGLDNFDA